MSYSNNEIEAFEKLFEAKLNPEQLESLKKIAPHHREIEEISPETEVLVVFARRKRMVNTAWKVIGGWAIQVGKWVAIITATLALYTQIELVFPSMDQALGEKIGEFLIWVAGHVGG